MRRKLKHPKRLCAADTPLLRERFAEDTRLSRAATNLPSLLSAYHAWLHEHGIEPDTGRMTEAGLAFFKRCLEEKNESRAHMATNVGRPTILKKP